MSTDADGGNPELQIQSQPDLSPTQLHADTDFHAAPGEAFSETIYLSATAAPATPTTPQVTRFDAAHPDGIALPDLTEPAGWQYFALTDTAPMSGPLSYRITYPGDAHHQAAILNYTPKIAKYAPQLTLNAPATDNRADPLTLTGQLTWTTQHLDTGGTSNIQVTRTDIAHPHRISLGSVPVNASGSFTVHDTPAIGGTDTYSVTYTGGTSYLPVTTTRTVTVNRIPTALSVTTNSSNYAYNSWAQVTAHLGTTYNNRQVTLYAQPYGGARTAVKTGTVDAHGNLSAWYRITRNTTVTASYAGTTATARPPPRTAPGTTHRSATSCGSTPAPPPSTASTTRSATATIPPSPRSSRPPSPRPHRPATGGGPSALLLRSLTYRQHHPRGPGQLEHLHGIPALEHHARLRLGQLAVLHHRPQPRPLRHPRAARADRSPAYAAKRPQGRLFPTTPCIPQPARESLV
ncbi:hypothetical protein GXW82_23905 [Streptacidiphilus sp. 4-A2]|nr:hypothetical protein [Streptacidiphilus sp. 4-A2]